MSTTYMPVIYASIGTNNAQTYYIDNNALVSTAWTQDCTLLATMATSDQETRCSTANVLSHETTDAATYSHRSAADTT